MKNFGRPGQFLKVWKKIRNVREKFREKIQGVKNFGNEGEGRFREILSCPPKMRVAPQMPPQIPGPGAATGSAVVRALIFKYSLHLSHPNQAFHNLFAYGCHDRGREFDKRRDKEVLKRLNNIYN